MRGGGGLAGRDLAQRVEEFAAQIRRCRVLAAGVETAAIDEAKVAVDQREPGKIDGIAVSLGEFEFAAGASEVTVSNAGTDGYVIIDAVQWLAK